MNAAVLQLPSTRADVERAILAACRTVAPTWPLDRFIAVNPHWGRIDRPFERVAEDLARQAGSTLWMPPEYYLDAWRRGTIRREHLDQARAEARDPRGPDELVIALSRGDSAAPALPLLSDVVDAGRDLVHEPAWRETITTQISQYCAAHFDHDQADWHLASRNGLYAGWREFVSRDHGVSLLMHAPQVARRARQLPDDAHECIEFVLDRLEVAPEHVHEFLTVALARIHGWAAWCAYLEWQSAPHEGAVRPLRELLAVRVAWEWLLDDGAREAASRWQNWREAWVATQRAPRDPLHSVLALWQRAAEIAYQAPLAAELVRAEETIAASADVQAVFCIDVRSEILRRSLEQALPGVRTHGFAGFFGLPIQYTPVGTSATRPQLPGLLTATLDASDSCGDGACDATISGERAARLAAEAAWDRFQKRPGAAFTLVETLGLGYLAKILGACLPSRRRGIAQDHAGLRDAQVAKLRPRLVLTGSDSLERRAQLAARVLVAMGLTGDYARLVLLAGHGSRSANNPQSAGLDCGACCGQSGEVNVRVLADLLNDAEVRRALRSRGLNIPDSTHFLPALHDTTSDDVRLLDVDAVPATHHGDVARLREALVAAGRRARAERSPRLGLAHLRERPVALERALHARANDWSETRPEWGLANNAAFIAAPRWRTRHIDLDGRAFLHDYDWRKDADGSLLELIMTAPMVVAHWINLQYYASTVDNRRYGSGNKVLHNVVGGRIGLFEGNGGDLRIGLPLQSLHDGERWVHTPLRLSVYIEAPRSAVAAVLSKHEVVRQLVDNGWIHLFQIEDGRVEKWQESRTIC